MLISSTFPGLQEIFHYLKEKSWRAKAGISSELLKLKVYLLYMGFLISNCKYLLWSWKPEWFGDTFSGSAADLPFPLFPLM